MSTAVVWMVVFPRNGYDMDTREQLTRMVIILALVNQAISYNYGSDNVQAWAAYAVWFMDKVVKVLFLVVARALLADLSISVDTILETHSNIALLMSLSGLFAYDILVGSA